MTTLIVILHIIVSLFLIGVVLLQSGKGAEIGAAFGGASSHTIFGSRGPGSFLSKLTTVAALVFIVTSLVLTILGSKGTGPSVVPEGKAIPAPAGEVSKPQESIPQKSAPQATPSQEGQQPQEK